MKELTLIPGYRCSRCGHTWVPRRPNPPKVCPNRKCKSPYWYRPREEVAKKRPEDIIAGPREDDLVEIPTELGKRDEPIIKGKGTPVWAVVSYATRHHMTAEQISELWGGYITVPEVQAAIDFFLEYPQLVDDKLSDPE